MSEEPRFTKKRCGYINEKQKTLLVDFMNKHPELQSAKFSATFTLKHAQKLWQEITAQLHEIPGAVKEWKQWRKTWQDMRSSTKAKNASIQKYARGTGGGPSANQVLTELDKNVLTLVGVSAVEGHMDVLEPNVQINWNNDSENGTVEYLENMEEEEDDKEEVFQHLISNSNFSSMETNKISTPSAGHFICFFLKIYVFLCFQCVFAVLKCKFSIPNIFYAMIFLRKVFQLNYFPHPLNEIK